VVARNEAVKTRSGPVATFRPGAAKRLRSHGLRPDSWREQPYLMLARYYNQDTNTLLTVDPEMLMDPMTPQRWNRYSYVANNPQIAVDRDGRNIIIVEPNVDGSLYAVNAHPSTARLDFGILLMAGMEDPGYQDVLLHFTGPGKPNLYLYGNSYIEPDADGNMDYTNLIMGGGTDEGLGDAMLSVNGGRNRSDAVRLRTVLHDMAHLVHLLNSKAARGRYFGQDPNHRLKWDDYFEDFADDYVKGFLGRIRQSTSRGAGGGAGGSNRLRWKIDVQCSPTGCVGPNPTYEWD